MGIKQGKLFPTNSNRKGNSQKLTSSTFPIVAQQKTAKLNKVKLKASLSDYDVQVARSYSHSGTEELSYKTYLLGYQFNYRRYMNLKVIRSEYYRPIIYNNAGIYIVSYV